MYEIYWFILCNILKLPMILNMKGSNGFMQCALQCACGLNQALALVYKPMQWAWPQRWVRVRASGFRACPCNDGQMVKLRYDGTNGWRVQLNICQDDKMSYFLRIFTVWNSFYSRIVSKLTCLKVPDAIPVSDWEILPCWLRKDSEITG